MANVKTHILDKLLNDVATSFLIYKKKQKNDD